MLTFEVLCENIAGHRCGPYCVKSGLPIENDGTIWDQSLCPAGKRKCLPPSVAADSPPKPTVRPTTPPHPWGLT